jgi:hypothetical protein
MPYTLSCYTPLQLAASAAVSPANETLSSCTAAPPVFTFTGEVTDNQTGTLSYYWQLPSGNGPVQTLNFAQAGTQTVTTTYQPSGDNTTGSGAIVVTSPGSATSNASTFTLSCTHSPVPSSLAVTVDVPAVTLAHVEQYYGTVTATGGTGPYTWAAATGLPDGLTAYTRGGTLTIGGTPTRPGRYLVGVSVSDGESPARTVTASIPIIVRPPVIAPPLPRLMLTPDVPTVTEVGDEEYYGTVTAFGGRAPYRWGPVTGLPDGLTAYASGATLTISGTPVRPGRYLVGVSVRDSERPGRTVTESIPITVKPAIVVGSPLRITAEVPAVATVGEEGYSGTATVSGGRAPYQWAAVTGLPDGLTAYANGATLTIGGTPAKAGRFLVGVSVSDGESPARTATESIPITVGPGTMPLKITTEVPAVATVGQEGYSGTATVSGGRVPYQWAAVTGLPDGLTATAHGATLTIGGTPAKAGPFTVGVSAGDGESPASTATASVTITVRPARGTPPTTVPPTTVPPTTKRAVPPLTITTAALPAATWKAAYSATVIASGGTGVDKWSAAGLPSGLTATANGATLTISGTPALAGALGDPVTDPVTVTVTDGGTPAHRTTRTFGLRINPPTLTLAGCALTTGTSGAAYSATVSAAGGAGAYKWSATGLPAGLSIGSATGTISGTAPTVRAATTYTVTVTVADSESPAQTATATFTVKVNAPTPTTSPSTPTTSPSKPASPSTPATPTTSKSSTSTG